MGCRDLLQGIFLTQGLNLHLLHWLVDSTEPPGKPPWLSKNEKSRLFGEMGVKQEGRGATFERMKEC